MNAIPTIIIAGTGSGTGKTTITCALASALARRNVDVRLFKAGPDYLDPTFHQAVLGRASRNLDGWMTNTSGVLSGFSRGTKDLQQPGIAIIEGVMGLYDGRSPESLEGSAAHLAQILGAPVVLIVDASGMGRSAAAVVEGFANHVADIDVLGAILNRVGSSRHTEIIRAALRNIKTRLPVTCLGGLPKNTDLFLPSRHLGLMAAHVSEPTRTEAGRVLWRSQLADWAEENLDIDALLSIANEARTPALSQVTAQHVASIRIGIAIDEAFHFYYPDNLDVLREMGAEIVPFSPLIDEELPHDLDGLIIGGGYPEEYAATLSANHSFKKSVAHFGHSNRPIYAECGGLMYLGSGLTDNDGAYHEMVGLLPLATSMKNTLRTLGYREVTTTQDSILGPAGTSFKGHEFHYSELTNTNESSHIFEWKGRKGSGSCGYSYKNVLATYIHSHWGSNTDVAEAFILACKQTREGTNVVR